MNDSVFIGALRVLKFLLRFPIFITCVSVITTVIFLMIYVIAPVAIPVSLALIILNIVSVAILCDDRFSGMIGYATRIESADNIYMGFRHVRSVSNGGTVYFRTQHGYINDFEYSWLQLVGVFLQARIIDYIDTITQ